MKRVRTPQVAALSAADVASVSLGHFCIPAEPACLARVHDSGPPPFGSLPSRQRGLNLTLGS